MCKGMIFGPYLLLLIKINSKWIKGLNVKLETVELLEENIGKKPLNIVLSNDILDMTPKSPATKANTSNKSN